MKNDHLTSNFRPTMFIASSSEGLEVARAVKSQFEKDIDVDIWNEDIFKINASYLSTLLNRAGFYDFAVMVLTPDDELQLRGEPAKAPRDNVIFEYGLFLGRLGPERAFMIKEESVRIFSDYQGISIATFRNRDNLAAAVGNACNQIRGFIRDFNQNYHIGLLPSTALAIGYYNNFIGKITEALIERKPIRIIEKDPAGKIISENQVDYEQKRPVIRILMPDRLTELEPTALKAKTRSLKQVSLDSSFRQFPFYISMDADDGDTLNLFDIPTTLLASNRAIEEVFDRAFLRQNNNYEFIQRKEIVNFERTLRLLIPDAIENLLITVEKLSDYPKFG